MSIDDHYAVAIGTSTKNHGFSSRFGSGRIAWCSHLFRKLSVHCLRAQGFRRKSGSLTKPNPKPEPWLKRIRKKIKKKIGKIKGCPISEMTLAFDPNRTFVRGMTKHKHIYVNLYKTAGKSSERSNVVQGNAGSIT